MLLYMCCSPLGGVSGEAVARLRGSGGSACLGPWGLPTDSMLVAKWFDAGGQEVV